MAKQPDIPTLAAQATQAVIALTQALAAAGADKTVIQHLHTIASALRDVTASLGPAQPQQRPSVNQAIDDHFSGGGNY